MTSEVLLGENRLRTAATVKRYLTVHSTLGTEATVKQYLTVHCNELRPGSVIKCYLTTDSVCKWQLEAAEPSSDFDRFIEKAKRLMGREGRGMDA